MAYLDWIRTEKVRAAADFLCNGGVLSESDARYTLRLLSDETEQHIVARIGKTFYAAYYPTVRHGGEWGPNCPVGLVDHYTAGVSSVGTLKWFSSRDRGPGTINSSAHFVMDHDGTAIVVVDPLTKVAFHARSANPTHIGIEHVNAGKLSKNNDGAFLYQEQHLYVVKNGNIPEEAKGSFWEPYTVAQVVSNVFLKRLLSCAIPTLKPEKFVDHETIDPGRKTDCGPLWPLTSLNRFVFSSLPVGKLESLSGEFLSHDKHAEFETEVAQLVP